MRLIKVFFLGTNKNCKFHESLPTGITALCRWLTSGFLQLLLKHSLASNTEVPNIPPSRYVKQRKSCFTYRPSCITTMSHILAIFSHNCRYFSLSRIPAACIIKIEDRTKVRVIGKMPSYFLWTLNKQWVFALAYGYSRRLTIGRTAVQSPCEMKAFYHILDRSSRITS